MAIGSYIQAVIDKMDRTKFENMSTDMEEEPRMINHEHEDEVDIDKIQRRGNMLLTH